MKILLLTPLFPPDTGDPAAYVKELATRLKSHQVTVLMYGYLPESIPHVVTVAIDKRQLMPTRLLKYTSALWRHSRTAELIVINNAPSTELPALLVSFLRPNKMLLCDSDPIATTAARSGLYRIIHQLLKRRCKKTIILPDGAVYKKPEVLPFTEIDEDIYTKRETWWDNHLNELSNI